MNPISFPEANFKLVPPKGMEDECDALEVFRDDRQIISCWQLTHEEMLEFFKNGGKLWIYVIGRTAPPIGVGITSPFECE